MDFLNKEAVRPVFEGKRVAIIGSGPGVMDNAPKFIDSHDVVVRVNNYKLFRQTGSRTDVHYSFYGRSVTKRSEDLAKDGVKLCMCKCPNSKFMNSEWHRKNGKTRGVDFRWIYKLRSDFWFCDTYVPKTSEFVKTFKMLDGHVPTTGFSAIIDVLSFEPESVYLTGFDFFKSRVHNVNESWRAGDPRDPIRHLPEKERQWLRQHIESYPIFTDKRLSQRLR